MKLTYKISLLIFLVTNLLISQNPSYFTIGENELKNADVYSILKTKSGNLYITTNQGLFHYKNTSVKRVKNSKAQLSISLFNLIENRKGEVFCLNLNGQVFKVVKDKLHLFYTIPKEHLSPRIKMVFNEDGNLIILAKNCILTNGLSDKVIYDAQDALDLIKLPNGKIILTTKQKDTLAYFNKDNFKYKALPKKGNTYRQVFLLRNILFGLTNDGYVTKLKDKTDKNFYLEESFNLEFVQFNDNEIWLRNKKGQISVLKFKDNKIQIQSVFNNTFISKLFLSSNKLLFLGTFGKGVYVIPNREIRTYDISDYGNVVSSIIVDDSNNIFLSDLSRGVFKFDSDPQSIYGDNSKLFLTSNYNANLIDESPKVFFNNKQYQGSLKDIYEVDSTTLLLAGSNGISILGNTSLFKNHKLIVSNKYKSRLLNNITFRCQSVVYAKDSKNIYAAGQDGLMIINDSINKSELFFNSKSIIAQDLIIDNEVLICATKKSGILFFKNDKFYNALNSSNGLESDAINKIVLKDDMLFVWHDAGFQVIDDYRNRQNIFYLGKPEGLVNESIRDFYVNNNKIWFLTTDKLLSFPISSLKKLNPKISVKIDSLLVSEKIFFDKKDFRYNQNNFKFYLSKNGLEFLSEAKLLYKLKNFEKKWVELPISTEFVEYKYLPSGNYNLEFKARFRDYETEPIAYPFVISKAFWNTIWFRVIVVVIAVCLILLVLRLRLNYLKSKNERQIKEEKLKSSLLNTELKALRSQMNPHFIFNSLNSIQDLILEKKTNDSYDYIVLFSELVRDILNYSNKNFIDIEDEVNFLDRYLKLEKLRFGEDFSYALIINLKNVNFKIPPLLIQPFVENALVHGLFHKKGQKSLTVKLSIDVDTLKCIVIDNGVGRKKSSEILKRQGKNHKSYALSAVRDRLSLLNPDDTEKFFYVFNDLKDEFSNSLGTKVSLYLPYKA